MMLSFATKKQLKIEEDDDIDSWDDDKEEGKLVCGKDTKVVKTNPRLNLRSEMVDCDWVNKYAAKSFQELKLHHTKVKFLKDWLQKNVIDCNKTEEKIPVLIIYGNSGSGKSSAITLLCQELSINLYSWQSLSSFSDFQGPKKKFPFTSNNKRRFKSKQNYQNENILTTFYDDDDDDAAFLKTPEQLLQDLSLQSRYPALSMTTNDTHGTSSTPRDPPQYIVQANQDGSKTQNCPSAILIEENIFDTSLFNNNLQDNIFDVFLSMKRPLIMIISNSIYKEDQYQLERSFASFSIWQTFFSIEWLFWAPVTEAKILKQLITIREKERLPQTVFPNDLLQELAVASNGDLRHAVHEFEFFARKYLFDPSLTRVSSINSMRSPSKGETSSTMTSRRGQKRKITSTLYQQQDNKNKKKTKSREGASVTSVIDLTEENEEELQEENVSHSSSNGTTAFLRSLSIPSVDSTASSFPPTPSDRIVHHPVTLTLSRDSQYSRSHCIAKFLHAKLDREGYCDCQFDESIARSEITVDYLLNTLQSNANENIDTVMTAAAIPIQETRSVEDTRLDVLKALERALGNFSDCDLWMTRKYDPSAHLDRSMTYSSSDLNSAGFHSFPEVYATSVSDRILSVTRGRGCSEQYELAKQKYLYRPPFQAVRSSQSYPLRMKRLQNHHELLRLRSESFQNKLMSWSSGRSNNNNSDLVVAGKREEEEEEGVGRSVSFMMDSIKTIALEVKALHLHQTLRPAAVNQRRTVEELEEVIEDIEEVAE